MTPTTDCCGAAVQVGPHDGGANEAFCRECDEPTCSACAGFYEAEDGYGDDGTHVRTVAYCRSCFSRRCGICHAISLPTTQRCQKHTDCYLCHASLAQETIHAAAPRMEGGPVEYACHGCYTRLMERFPLGREPLCDGCGARFGEGCECLANKRAIGRGERSHP